MSLIPFVSHFRVLAVPLMITIYISGCNSYSRISNSPYDAFSKKAEIITHPFQVIYLENVERYNITDSLRVMEKLGPGTILKVGEKGHLVLGHYSGYLLEFEDDTLINIATLENQVVQFL